MLSLEGQLWLSIDRARAQLFVFSCNDSCLAVGNDVSRQSRVRHRRGVQEPSGCRRASSSYIRMVSLTVPFLRRFVPVSFLVGILAFACSSMDGQWVIIQKYRGKRFTYQRSLAACVFLAAAEVTMRDIQCPMHLDKSWKSRCNFLRPSSTRLEKTVWTLNIAKHSENWLRSLVQLGR